MTPSETAAMLSAMADRAEERAEYYAARAVNGGRPAPAAEAFAWTLRAVFMEGASKCRELERKRAEETN